MAEQIPNHRASMAEDNTPRTGVIPFLRQFKRRVLFLSVVLIVPCVWRRRIETGDLASHVYNAWLAQLIAKGQAPGLYIAKQWNNVLFDVTLLRVANLVGFAAAQKIAVSICILVFFWGVFEFSRLFEPSQNGHLGFSRRVSPCSLTAIRSVWDS